MDRLGSVKNTTIRYSASQNHSPLKFSSNKFHVGLTTRHCSPSMGSSTPWEATFTELLVPAQTLTIPSLQIWLRVSMKSPKYNAVLSTCVPSKRELCTPGEKVLMVSSATETQKTCQGLPQLKELRAKSKLFLVEPTTPQFQSIVKAIGNAMLLEMASMGNQGPVRAEIATFPSRLNWRKLSILLQDRTIPCLSLEEMSMPVEIILQVSLEPFSIKNSPQSPQSNFYLIQNIF